MKTKVEVPADAARWLRSVDRRLGALASGQRAEVVDGLRAHLVEAIADGEASADVIARLGDAAEVARTSIVEFGGGGEGVRLPRYLTAKRVLQILAFLVIFGGSIALLHQTRTVTAFATPPMSPGDAGFSTQVGGYQYEMTLLQIGGLPTLGVVALFVAAAGAPLLIRGKAWQPVSVVSAVVLTIPAVLLLGWSLSDFFLPAAAASIVALFLRPRQIRGPSTKSYPRR